MKSILGRLQKFKNGSLCHFRSSKFCSFAQFLPSKSTKIHTNQNSEPLNGLNWHFALVESPKLISRKFKLIVK